MSYKKYLSPLNLNKTINLDSFFDHRAIKKNSTENSIIKYKDRAGVGCKPTLSPVPQRNRAPGEDVITGLGDWTIVGGVDRPKGLGSGYGGAGDPAAACIDICAGNMGPYARNQDDQGSAFYYNPNQTLGASRLLVSQKTDVDANAAAGGLPEGSGNAVGKSAVLAKADSVRLVSRFGTKIVAGGVDSRDSQGDKILENGTIDLIGGGDDTDMQPMVLGKNLMKALSPILLEIDDLRETTTSLLKYQDNLNSKTIEHNHNSPFFGYTTAPSFNLMYQGFKAKFQMTCDTEGSLIKMATNKAISKQNAFGPIGSDYVLSALCNLT
jgi:hypothetical protein